MKSTVADSVAFDGWLNPLSLIALVLLAGCSAPPATPTPRPTRTPFPADLAVPLALESLHGNTAMGYLLGEPTLLRGELTTLDQALVFLNGPTALIPPRANLRRVWLVVTRGKWLLHIPGGHGDPRQRTPTIMSRDKTVENLYAGVVLDAVTGDTLEQGGIRPSQEREINAMPALELPGESSAPSPTP